MGGGALGEVLRAATSTAFAAEAIGANLVVVLADPCLGKVQSKPRRAQEARQIIK